MSAGSLLSIGTRAMFANYAALQTTGHNIANANVEGYSRQRVELATAQGQFSGAGFFGKGVDVVAVTRAHNEFLTREAASTASTAAADAARLEQLSRLENIFPPGEAGLGQATNQFLNAMVDLASHPADASTREVALSRARDMAQRFANAGAQLDSLQAGVTQDLKLALTDVNSLTASIALVNDQIARATGSGQQPNDLLDQRDRLLRVGRIELGERRVGVGDSAVGAAENRPARDVDGQLLGAPKAEDHVVGVATERSKSRGIRLGQHGGDELHLLASAQLLPPDDFGLQQLRVVVPGAHQRKRFGS